MRFSQVMKPDSVITNTLDGKIVQSGEFDYSYYEGIIKSTEKMRLQIYEADSSSAFTIAWPTTLNHATGEQAWDFFLTQFEEETLKSAKFYSEHRQKRRLLDFFPYYRDISDFSQEKRYSAWVTDVVILYPPPDNLQYDKIVKFTEQMSKQKSIVDILLPGF